MSGQSKLLCPKVNVNHVNFQFHPVRPILPMEEVHSEEEEEEADDAWDTWADDYALDIEILAWMGTDDYEAFMDRYYRQLEEQEPIDQIPFDYEQFYDYDDEPSTESEYEYEYVDNWLVEAAVIVIAVFLVDRRWVLCIHLL